MKQIIDAVGSELYWEQPKLSQRSFVLRSPEDSFAQLDFTSSFNATASASSADGSWIIQQMGFLSDHVSIQIVDSELELANYQPDWMGTSGEIQFSMGGKYRWNVIGLMGSKFCISRVDGPGLITYVSGARNRKITNLFKQQAQMVIAPDTWQIKHLSVLVLLGWYLVIMHYEEAAVIASTASLGALY